MASKLWWKMQKRIHSVAGREVEAVSRSLAVQLFGGHEFGGKAEAANDETADFKVAASERERERAGTNSVGFRGESSCIGSG